MANPYTFADLYSRVSQYLGTGASPNGSALTLSQQLVNSGIRRFLDAHNWTFKRNSQDAQLSIEIGDLAAVLPTDFVTLLTDVTHDGPALPMVTMTDEATVRRHRAKNPTQATPYLFSVQRVSDPAATDPVYQFIFSPIPDATYTVSYSYEQQPADLEFDTDVPWGAQAHGETILLSCLAAAEQYADDEMSLHTKNYEIAVARSIQVDHKLPGTKFGTGNNIGTNITPTTEGPAVQSDGGDQ